MQVGVDEGGFVVEASLLGDLLDVEPSLVPGLMASSEITCLCERGSPSTKGSIGSRSSTKAAALACGSTTVGRCCIARLWILASGSFRASCANRKGHERRAVP